MSSVCAAIPAPRDAQRAVIAPPATSTTTNIVDERSLRGLLSTKRLVVQGSQPSDTFTGRAARVQASGNTQEVRRGEKQQAVTAPEGD